MFLPAGWLVSTFQVSGTPDLYFYKPNNIITSILPRQEEREKQRKRACVCAWTSASGVEEWDVRGKQERSRRTQARESTRWMPRC